LIVTFIVEFVGSVDVGVNVAELPLHEVAPAIALVPSVNVMPPDIADPQLIASLKVTTVVELSALRRLALVGVAAVTVGGVVSAGVDEPPPPHP
jgi:hypothetical protein